MNKKYTISIIAILLVALVFSLLMSYMNKSNDAVKFKNEYQNLNGKITDNGKKNLDVKIDKKNKIKYSTYEEIIEVLDGTGVIYFGFPECPWCRNIAPVLVDAANETSIDKIHYFNALSIRDTKSLDKNGNIVIDKKGTDQYYQLIDKLKDFLGEYDGLNNHDIKRLYFPTLVFVKDGKILSVKEGSLDSQADPYVHLNKEQKDELKKIYIDEIHEVLGDLCDKMC